MHTRIRQTQRATYSSYFCPLHIYCSALTFLTNARTHTHLCLCLSVILDLLQSCIREMSHLIASLSLLLHELGELLHQGVQYGLQGVVQDGGGASTGA